MGKPYVIVRHGKRILVKDLETPNSLARRSRRGIQDGFAMVPLTWAADVAKATNSPAALITSLLVYLSWKAKIPTFTLSNDCLRQFGVNRKRIVLRAYGTAAFVGFGRPTLSTCGDIAVTQSNSA